MVGKDDMSVLCSSKHGDKNENSTYSRRKKEKKAKVQMAENSAMDNSVDTGDYMTLVDNFVQDVIERAKQEYLSSCPNGGTSIEIRDSDEDEGARLRTDEERSREYDRPKKNTGTKKTNGKGSGRRKPHYKYSGPVDEKEISGYESPEASNLLKNRSEFELEDTAEAQNRSVYARVATALRRLISCCIGKTWSP